MCQRYVLPDQLTAEREFLPATAWWNFTPKYNVAATQYVPAIRLHENQSEGVMLRWGLIPSWLEGEPSGPPHARVSDDHMEKSPTYRDPWLAGRRCILPVAGFYIWQLTEERYRQPYFVRLTKRAVFGVAGLWDRWVSEEDDVIESCSVVTVPANELVSEISRADRGMPAILRRRHYEGWLRGTPEAAKAVLQPYDPRWMHAYPVSPRINAADVDDPLLIRIAS